MKMKNLITAEYVKTVLKEREKDMHKGECGKVLVIAGSKGMAGAAVLCGKGAYRAGAGLVRISIGEELFPIIQVALPEAMCRDRFIRAADLEDYDSIAIGPGLSDNPENEALIEMILAEYGKTVVLDADGLNAITKAGMTGRLKNSKARAIITPHMGEANRLLEGGTETDRVKVAEKLVEKTGAIVVLKGAGTIVASAEEGIFINNTGNPGMATGGSGDVLTGIIAAFAGQGKSPWDAAKAGTFIHGMAGDIAAETFGEYGMTAMDIAEATALSIKKIADLKTEGR